MSSAIWRPFCLGFNVLIIQKYQMMPITIQFGSILQSLLHARFQCQNTKKSVQYSPLKYILISKRCVEEWWFLTCLDLFIINLIYTHQNIAFMAYIYGFCLHLICIGTPTWFKTYRVESHAIYKNSSSGAITLRFRHSRLVTDSCNMHL